MTLELDWLDTSLWDDGLDWLLDELLRLDELLWLLLDETLLLELFRLELLDRLLLELLLELSIAGILLARGLA